MFSPVLILTLPCSHPIPIPTLLCLLFTYVGQSQGLIHDIPTVQELIDRCIEEAIVANEVSMRKLQGMQVSASAHATESRRSVI